MPWKDNAGNADCLCLDFKARFLNVNHLGLKRAVAARTFFARAADVDFCVRFFSVCCISCGHGNHNQQTVDTGTIHGLAFRIDLTLSDSLLGRDDLCDINSLVFSGLEVNHPADTVNVVVTEYIWRPINGSVIDFSVDIVELHSGICIPIPIQTEGE